MGYDENKDLKEWSKDEVTAWLLYLKGYMEIEFDVQKVAIRGSAFALRTKEDMKSLTSKIVGIRIFTAKEALLKNQSGGGQQRGLANRCPYAFYISSSLYPLSLPSFFLFAFVIYRHANSLRHV